MAVAWFKNPILDTSVPLLKRDSVNERTFGVSRSKRHPAYVYSINKNAGLMHRVERVDIHWYAIVGPIGSRLGRLKQPAMIAQTVCRASFALLPHRVRTCRIPFEDSILCGRCHGEPASFGKNGKHAGMKRQEANVKLGCIEAGYPSALETS